MKEQVLEKSSMETLTSQRSQLWPGRKEMHFSLESSIYKGSCKMATRLGPLASLHPLPLALSSRTKFWMNKRTDCSEHGMCKSFICIHSCNLITSPLERCSHDSHFTDEQREVQKVAPGWTREEVGPGCECRLPGSMLAFLQLCQMPPGRTVSAALSTHYAKSRKGCPMVHLIYCKNFCKCHYVPPPSTIKTRKEKIIDQ
jgi:hypothetical protein